MSRKKVLIIEDEEVCTQLVRLVALKSDVDILTAVDGEEGIQKALSEKPDLIFLDIMLPKVNGFEVVKALRGQPSMANVPIVVISARSGNDGQKILDTGCQQFISKPFKVGQIREAMEKFLGWSR
ncbi:MAG TPA: response regulator [Nitrospiria bacterium]